MVFDLESHTRWDHLAPISASTVIEDYFNLDLYSNQAKRLVARYAALTEKSTYTQQEEEEAQEIRAMLDKIEFESSPELVAQYRSLRAQESTN